MKHAQEVDGLEEITPDIAEKVKASIRGE
jgi:predicted small metal-binding protein